MRFRRSATVLVLFVSCLVVSAPGADASIAWHNVTFDGISLQVPAAWPVFNLARHPATCPRLDRHAVYLGTPGPDPACPAGLLGKTEAVAVLPLNQASPDRLAAGRPATIGGHPALTNSDAAITHTIIDILPSAGVEVSLSYGRDPALVRAIQATIRTGRSARPVQLRPAAAIPAAAAQGVFQGRGFDTCAAPSAASMSHWLRSPFRAVGIYIGGVNRACAQASLTPGWLAAIRAAGWHYFPLYVGLQASCVQAVGDATINPADAAAEGKAAADDAVTQAQDLGIPRGTPLIYDMEGYSGCSAEVIAFLSAWDSELHVQGYGAGVYESFSDIGGLVSAAGQMTEPDVIHYADWDGKATTQSSYMPSGMWTNHQRLHQYLGGQNQTWGGVTLNIDSDQLDVNLGGGAVAAAPSRPAFRIAVGMNANGSAEWFAKAANDTLLHGYQQAAAPSGWAATATVGNSPGNIVSNPAVAADWGGGLTLFARSSTGQVLHAWQQAGAPDNWAWGGAIGGRSPGTGGSDPAAIRTPGREVEVFVTDAGGSVVTTRQKAPDANTSWTAWASMRGSCASSPVPFVNASRDLEVFCRTARGTLAVDRWLGGSWHGWTTAGASPANLTGVPAVASDAAGETEVFSATKSGALAAAHQRSGTSAWAWASSLGGSTKIENSPAASSWPGGQIAVFAHLASGQLGYISQRGSSAADGWTGWALAGVALLGSPVAWLSSGGSPEAAVLTRTLSVAVASYSAGSWTGWTDLGGGF